MHDEKLHNVKLWKRSRKGSFESAEGQAIVCVDYVSALLRLLWLLLLLFVAIGGCGACANIVAENECIEEHKQWALKLKNSGQKIASGYLIDNLGNPGGGGVLIVEANNFKEAKLIMMNDPMIKNNLVEWEIHEWIPVVGEL